MPGARGGGARGGARGILTYEALSAARAAKSWALIAQPRRWSAWAPHVRGAWGLGEPEVSKGARGYVRLFGVVPVPARITAKRAGRSWTWRVGMLTLVHRVEPRGRGSLVAIDIEAPGALEPLVRASYGPVVGVLVRRLARVAERD